MDTTRHEKRDIAVDGWGGFEAYMKKKEEKQASQFKRDSTKYKTAGSSSSIFKGVSIYVNGYTDPPAEKLKRIMMMHGGRYIYYPNKSNTTHVIANNLAYTKIKELKNEKVVTPAWITDSVEAGKLLPHAPYLIYRPKASNQTLHRFKGTISPQEMPTSKAKGSGESPKTNTSIQEMTRDTQYRPTDILGASNDTSEAKSDSGLRKEKPGGRKSPIERGITCSSIGQKQGDPKGSHGAKRSVSNSREGGDQLQCKGTPVGTKDHRGKQDREKIATGLTNKSVHGESHVTNETGVTYGKRKQEKQGMKCDQELGGAELDPRTRTERTLSQEKPARISSQFNRSKSAAEPKVTYMSKGQFEANDATWKKKKSITEGYLSRETTANVRSQETSANGDEKNDQQAATDSPRKRKKSTHTSPSTEDLSSDGIAKCLKLKNSQSNSTYFPKATDPNFLPTFYRHSSFYHLTTWRAEHRLFVKELKANHDGTHPGKDKLIVMYGHRRKLGNDTKKDESMSSVGPGEGGQDVADWHSEKDTGDTRRVIMHIDMDAFFVAVSLLNYPELRGKPIAVAHYAAKAQKRLFPEADQRESQDDVGTQSQIFSYCTSSSGCSGTRSNGDLTGRKTGDEAGSRKDDNEIEEDDDEVFLPSPTRVAASESENFSSLAAIASCSYEARVFGVKNGMIMKLAKELCPDLRTIPYDFDGYYRVSRILYKVVASYSHDLQATSCDEVLMDVTDLMEETGATGEEIAEAMRQEIFERTKCTASAGLAPNVILARLCTKAAKPDGVYVLTEDGIWDFLKNAPVGDLPGIGRAFTKKMHGLGVYTCADLQKIPLKTVQKEFGPKTGEMLYQNCRGHDTKPMRSERERKYVSVEVNYGIRFDEEDEAHQFIHRLSREVQRKLQRLSLVGRSITLKLKVRRAGTPVEDIKFMGYGVFDNKIKTVSLSQETGNSGTIYRACKGLLFQLAVVARDIRGVGIQISKIKRLSSLKGMSKAITDLLPKKEDLPAKSEPVTPPPAKRGERHYSLLDFVTPKKSKVTTPSPISNAKLVKESKSHKSSPYRKVQDDENTTQRQNHPKMSVRNKIGKEVGISRMSSSSSASEFDCSSSPTKEHSKIDSARLSENIIRGRGYSQQSKITRHHTHLADTLRYDKEGGSVCRSGSSKRTEIPSEDINTSKRRTEKKPVRKSLQFEECSVENEESSSRERQSSPTTNPGSLSYEVNSHGENVAITEATNRNETVVRWKEGEVDGQRTRDCQRRRKESKETKGKESNPTKVPESRRKGIVATSRKIGVVLDRSKDDPSLHPSQIDVSVLTSLPGDIRDQVISQYNLDIDSTVLNKIDPNQASTSTGITAGLDQDVLQNLPPDLLQEVLEAESLKTKKTDNTDGPLPERQINTESDVKPLKSGDTGISNFKHPVAGMGLPRGGKDVNNGRDQQMDSTIGKTARKRKMQSENTTNDYSDKRANLPEEGNGNAIGNTSGSKTPCKLSSHKTSVPINIHENQKQCDRHSKVKKKVFKITNYLLSKKQKTSPADVSPPREVSSSRAAGDGQAGGKLGIGYHGASSAQVHDSRTKCGRSETGAEESMQEPTQHKKTDRGRAGQSTSTPGYPNEVRDRANEENRSTELSSKKDEISLGGASTIEGVKAKLKQWVQLFEIPLDEDISHVVHFLRSLILDRNLAMVYQLLRAFKRIVSNSGRQEWMDAYVIITERVQSTVGHIYGGSLKLD